MTSPDATYGELIDSAFAATGRASFAMLRCRFTDKAQAVAAVAAYRDLLDAIRTDMRYFIPLTRRPTDNALWIEPPAAPAGSMLANASDILAARARRSATSGDPAALAEPARLWRQAATSLRAAHDLLDTHRTPGFRPRTPDAWLLDDARPQAAAIESLAGLLRSVAGSGQALALRAREVDSDVDCADILDAAPLRVAAATLMDYSRNAEAIPAFDEVTAARATSRPSSSAQPLGAALQAMAGLRQYAWEHSRSPHPSIATISLYAVLATTVHQHAAVITAALGARLPDMAGQLRRGFAAEHLRRSSQLSATAADAWRQVYKLCVGLQTTEPSRVSTYQQIMTVKTALEAVTRTDDGWRRASDIVPDAQAAAMLAAQLRQLVGPIEEVSAWNLAALSSLANTERLYVPAGSLHRDELSNDPRLATARLTRKSVPLPQHRATELLTAFSFADRATWAAMKANCAAGMLGAPARPALSRIRAANRTECRPAVGL